MDVPIFTGGHNGLKSIIERLGSNGPDFVLSKFKPDERDIATEMVTTAADAVECWLKEGAKEAMNRYN